MDIKIEESNSFDNFLKLENSFSKLPTDFYSLMNIQVLKNPFLVSISEKSLLKIGLEYSIFKNQDVIEVFTGNKTLETSIPLSAVYSGQFHT